MRLSIFREREFIQGDILNEMSHYWNHKHVNKTDLRNKTKNLVAERLVEERFGSIDVAEDLEGVIRK